MGNEGATLGFPKRIAAQRRIAAWRCLHGHLVPGHLDGVVQVVHQLRVFAGQQRLNHRDALLNQGESWNPHITSEARGAGGSCARAISRRFDALQLSCAASASAG